MIGLLLSLAWADPLGLDEVITAVDDRLPYVMSAEADLDAALARALYARSAFDIGWHAEVSDLDGYYDNTRVKTYVGVESLFGPELNVGWRYGQGNFASYDKAQTLDRGEFNADLTVPITDLGRTSAQAKARSAAFKVEASQAKLDDVMRKARRGAASQYWAWVRAGRELAIAQDLLGRAELRAAGLARQVEEGQVARIAWLDNEQVVASRSAKVAAAEAKLVSEAQKLGVYYRDAYGEPIVPSADDLPPSGGVPSVPQLDVRSAMDIAMENRPDLQALEASIDSAEVLLERARRDRLPDLSAMVGVSRDVGDGEESLMPTALSTGLSIDGSFLWRAERAQVRETSALMRSLQAELRWAQDQVRAEIEGLAARRIAAVQRWEDAQRALEIAEELLVLERRRLELGGSDVFRLVQREEKALDAASSVAAAEAEYGALTAAWNAALGE